MKNKEEIFKLLRESVEDEREAWIVEELVNKIEFIMPLEVVDKTHLKFDGVIYRESPKDHHYYKSSSLHRVMYSYFYGVIPNGFDVHHKDLNPVNNDISNLQLLTKSQHSKIHGKIRRKEINRQCAICGKIFTVPAKSTQKFCSYACAGKANTVSEKYESKESRQCEFCGKTFSAYKSSPQKFCSTNCSGKARSKQIVRQCPCCGKFFTFSKYLNQKFCSRSCSHKFRTKNSIEEKVCLFCGKTFNSHKWKRQKYCCRACSAKARWKNKK